MKLFILLLSLLSQLIILASAHGMTCEGLFDTKTAHPYRPVNMVKEFEPEVEVSFDTAAATSVNFGNFKKWSKLSSNGRKDISTESDISVSLIPNAFNSLQSVRISGRSASTDIVAFAPEAFLKYPNDFHALEFTRYMMTSVGIIARGTPGLLMRIHLYEVLRQRNYLIVHHEFDVRLSSNFETFRIPLSAFRKTEVPYSLHQPNGSVAFSVLEGKSGSSFEIEIAGPLIFEKDFSGTLQEAARQIIGKSWFLNKPGVLQIDPSVDRVGTIEKFLRNLYSPDVQTKTVALLKSKNDAELAALLGRHGVNLVEMTTQMKSGDFFQMSEVALRQPALPVETGSFGIEHHRLSHVAQYLAGTTGMSAKEIRFMNSFISGIFDKSQDLWAIWDILFDAPGNTVPNGPRFWRDRLNDAGRQ